MNRRPNSRHELLGRVVDHLAEHGIGNLSLRALAGHLDTSHRMLIYHFGSREDLLAAVVDAVEDQQRDLLGSVLDPGHPTLDQARVYWNAVVAAAERHGHLFFELAAHAMQGQDHAMGLRRSLIEPWLAPLEQLCRALGIPEHDVAATARMSLGTARGLLFDLLLTGDREAVEQAAERLNQMLLDTASRP